MLRLYDRTETARDVVPIYGNSKKDRKRAPEKFPEFLKNPLSYRLVRDSPRPPSNQ